GLPTGWIARPEHYAVLTHPQDAAIAVGRSYGGGPAYGWYWSAYFGGVAAAPRTTAVFDAGYHSRWTAQSPDPTLAPGQETTLVVALLNTGYRGWYQGVPNQQADLGTAAPLDVSRSDLADAWLSPSRPASATAKYVWPGPG